MIAHFAPTHNQKHKFKIVFLLPTGRTKTVYFGAQGYQDYTQHHDISRKKLYIQRHQKRENWQTPFTAGSCSRWILWNKPSLQASFEDFVQRFHLILP